MPVRFIPTDSGGLFSQEARNQAEYLNKGLILSTVRHLLRHADFRKIGVNMRCEFLN
jgi:hypothetical protein